jgi:hypothetical protein
MYSRKANHPTDKTLQTHKLFSLACLVIRTHRHNQNIRKVNESFENVAKFKYLGITLTNQKKFMTKSGVVYIQGMLAIIQSKIFCLPVPYQKT